MKIIKYLKLCELVVTQLDKDLAMIDALRELKTELRGHKEVQCCSLYPIFLVL